jgi:hypothetical protein
MKNSQTIPDLLDALRFPSGKFPRETIDQLIARRDEATPALLALFEDPGTVFEDTIYCEELLTSFATYLLAYFGEARFCPLLLDLMRYEGEGDDYEDYWGDLMFEDLPRILASVYNDDAQALSDLVLDPEAPHNSRSTVLDAMSILVAQGRMERSYLLHVMKKVYSPTVDNSNKFFLVSFVGIAAELQMREFESEVLVLLNGQLSDFDTPENYLKELAIPPEEARKNFFADHHHQPIQDIEKDMAWWLERALEVEAEDEEGDEGAPEWSDTDLDNLAAGTPVVREELKVGRNDLCPCGSGKKFKKCCGA